MRFLLLLCTLCVPQTASTPVMSPAFSKAALRALFAIRDESVTAAHSYINDASVLAESQTELKAVSDLYSVEILLTKNSVKEHDRKRDTIVAYQGAGKQDYSLDFFLDHDPILQGFLKQDADCVGAMESSLRAGLYSALPTVCFATLPTSLSQ
jgi:hypothetical protein